MTSEEVIVLPVSFHILKGVDMVKSGRWMAASIDCNDVPVLLSEVNRIWSQASIRFELALCHNVYVSGADVLIKAIEESTRDANAFEEIKSLIHGVGFQQSDTLNVYVIPFMGSTYQGLAKIGGSWAVVGVWTDKPSGGRLPPVKTLLVEIGSVVYGSLARTIAHELGHNLGLHHPKNGLVTFPRLMGGPYQGYNLTGGEISNARYRAGLHKYSFTGGRSS